MMNEASTINSKDSGRMTALIANLSNLNNIYSVWYFNSYLRVTYVAPAWLIVWDHRQNPPSRFDFKDIGDHEAVCSMVAGQLQTLVEELRQ